MSGSRVRLHDFYPLFVELRATPTELPFELGGATQMGQLGDHHNNQDALALVSGRSHLVAVISDGCASAGARHSHNEVGAKFQAMLFANMADEVVADGGVQRLVGELPRIEERLLADLRAVVATLSAHARAPSDAALTQSFFTATLLAVVIDAEKYVVLGCGDGVLWINDRCIDFEEEEGRYLSARLASSLDLPANRAEATQDATAAMPEAIRTAPVSGAAALEDGASAIPSAKLPGSPMLRVLHEGATRELHRLFLATDGFIDIFERYPNLLDRLAPAASHTPQEGMRGYNEHLVSEFRRKFWYENDVETWALDHGAHDDRTFALIRRAEATREVGRVPTDR